MLRMARHAHQLTGARNLCLAGGVALNCVGNGRILREGPFDDIWIQPAAGDAGGALGIALALWHRYLGKPRCSAERAGRWRSASAASQFTLQPAMAAASASGSEQRRSHRSPGEGGQPPPYDDDMSGSLLGPSFSEEEIGRWLREQRYPATVLDRAALARELARRLADGQVVGLLQGRMEFGPRALGSRSILGDPRSPQMQSTMNLKIKFRESFRPFAPIVLREHVQEWFQLRTDSPYMLLVAPVEPSRRVPVTAGGLPGLGLDRLQVPRSHIPAVTHVDYSARVQTIRRETQPFLHAVLQAFDALTGCPVLVNTSFNVRGEPIVCTPQDAYRCFMRTHIDTLVLETYLLEKAAQPPREDRALWRTEFSLD